jgi:hypothetical protein
MIHYLLLFIFDKNSPIDTQNEGRSVILEVIVELGISMLRRKWLSLIFGAELNLDVIFGWIGF